MMRRNWHGAALSAAMALTLYAQPAAAQEATRPADDWKKTRTGLQYKDMKVGTGPAPARGQTCSVHYTGWLYADGKKGKKFDSSLGFGRGKPFPFAIGEGQVIPGWDEGVSTMKAGGKRILVIPPDLAYGKRGAGGKIPPDATLIFEVELLEVK